MALLDARLERLTAEERAVIERASIEGRTFHVGSVRALGPGDADVSEPIMALIRRDLIRPDRPALAGQDALRFRHILIRDAAYRRIPKQTRAQLHERHAGWLVETAGDRRAEFEEIVAFHLEQAYRLRIELGQQDAETESLATRAAAHFIASGRRAAERGDAVAASNLFGRAADLMPASHPDRPKVLADQCVNLTESGLADRAREAVEQAEAAIEDMSDPSAEIRVRFARLRLDSAMEPEGVATRMRREAERAIPLLEAIGDDAGLAQAWMLAGDAELYWAHDAAMLDAFRRSLQHAERAGDRSATSEAALWCMLGIASGPTPADQGLLAIEAIMESAPDNLELKAWSQIQRGKLLAMLGRADEGRSLVQASRATFEELGRALTFGGSGMETATFEELAGDGDAAERELRSSYETLESLGEKGYLSTAVGRLARYVAIRGDLEEAEVLVSIGREASASEDVYSQVAWRQALALVHARRGELESASALTEEALTLAEDTDDCQLQGELFEDVAEVHRLAGRTGQAAAAIERAVDVWNRKGAVAVVDRLRSRLSELTGGPGS